MPDEQKPAEASSAQQIAEVVAGLRQLSASLQTLAGSDASVASLKKCIDQGLRYFPNV
jgi:hypothetical protein